MNQCNVEPSFEPGKITVYFCWYEAPVINFSKLIKAAAKATIFMSFKTLMKLLLKH